MQNERNYSIKNGRTYRVSKRKPERKIRKKDILYWLLYCLILFLIVGPFVILNL